MQGKAINIVLLALKTVLLLFTVASATDGKIKGKVVSSQTGEPLPQANIVITGTALGSAADVSGQYAIANIPAGIYALKASFIGYRELTITQVKVSEGLTTTIDFKLVPEAMEVTAISVEAKRPLVNMSATNAVRIVSRETFDDLPVRGARAILALQPGIVVQDNQLYIRGGRVDEVGYMLEGARTTDLQSGGNAVTVIPEALQEAQIQAGGYNAEFGGANAGIISQTLRSGTADLHFSLRAETDQFPGYNPGEKNLGTYNYGYENYVMTLSGPLYSNRVKAFVALQRQQFDDTRRVFLTGFNLQEVVAAAVERHPEILVDQAKYVRLNEQGEIELLDGGGFSGPAGDILPAYAVKPGNIADASARNSLNGILTFDLNPVQLRLSVASSFQKDDVVSDRPILNQLANTARTDISSNLLTAKFTHTLNSSSYYELRASYYDLRQKRYLPEFGDDYIAYGDSLAWDRAFGPKVSSDWRARDNRPVPFDIFNFPISRPTRLLSYRRDQQTYLNFSFDFSRQQAQHHIKLGAAFEKWQLRRLRGSGLGSTASYGFLRVEPDLARAIKNGSSDPLYEEAFLRWRGGIDAYGYDRFGNRVDHDTELWDGPKRPVFASVYLQDKFESGDLVINAGLRLDYHDLDRLILKEPEAPPFDPGVDIVPLDAFRKDDSKTSICPRLGFGFPVNERTVFHAQYGHFVQSPRFHELYAGRGGSILTRAGFEIEPIKTVQYEIGFNRAVSDYAVFDITAFYRDIKGQLQTSDVLVDPESSEAASYTSWRNQDFSTAKGIEVALNLRRTRRLAAALNYAFQDAQATGSFPNVPVLGGGSPALQTVITPVDYNQKHSGALSLDYRFGRDDGGALLQRLGANLLFTFNSGHPYTLAGGGVGQQGVDLGAILGDYRSREFLENINASTTPWVSQLDLRLDKTVSIGWLDANFFVYVQNLLNTKNTVRVYQRTGNARDDGFLTNPDLSAKAIARLGPAFIDLYRLINLENRQHWWQQNAGVVPSLLGAGSDFDLYGKPREIRFGFSIEY